MNLLLALIKKIISIELKKSFNYKIIDFIYFHNDKTKLIIGYEYKLFFISFPDFSLVKEISKSTRFSSNSLIQINSKEICFLDKNLIKIINVENFQEKINLQVNYHYDNIFKLNDNTIVQGSNEGIKRFLLKTMEELPMVEVNDYDEFDEYDDYYYTEKLCYLYQLSNGNIITCYSSGKIKIGKLGFI